MVPPMVKPLKRVYGTRDLVPLVVDLDRARKHFGVLGPVRQGGVDLGRDRAPSYVRLLRSHEDEAASIEASRHKATRFARGPVLSAALDEPRCAALHHR